MIEESITRTEASVNLQYLPKAKNQTIHHNTKGKKHEPDHASLYAAETGDLSVLLQIKT